MTPRRFSREMWEGATGGVESGARRRECRRHLKAGAGITRCRLRTGRFFFGLQLRAMMYRIARARPPRSHRCASGNPHVTGASGALPGRNPQSTQSCCSQNLREAKVIARDFSIEIQFSRTHGVPLDDTGGFNEVCNEVRSEGLHSFRRSGAVGAVRNDGRARAGESDRNTRDEFASRWPMDSARRWLTMATRSRP